MTLFAGCRQAPDWQQKYTRRGRTVEVVLVQGKYTLLRQGKPYFIHGAAGYDYYNKLARYGGNSVRVWDTNRAQQVLDSAQKNGLTVTLGLWMQREREGFNYYDKEAVAQQLQRLRQVVKKYKDHPALLMWGVGNELYAEGSNVKIWDAVNEVAEMIHEVDPNHPTTTTVMNVPTKVVNLVTERCPALDILSINSFAALQDVPGEMSQTDWKGPYIISEFGARGYWEAYTTWWLAPIEQTSSEKAEFAVQHYKQVVQSDTNRCLGSYVFLWGSKQETTPTWFGLLSEDGQETATVQALRKIWRGTEPANYAPYIAYATLDGRYAFDNIYLKPDQEYHSQVFTYDPDNDPLQLRWEVLPETASKDGNADEEKRPAALDVVTQQEGRTCLLRTPQKEGPYRLFVYVYDGHNNYATANVPFYVQK